MAVKTIDNIFEGNIDPESPTHLIITERQYLTLLIEHCKSIDDGDDALQTKLTNILFYQQNGFRLRYFIDVKDQTLGYSIHEKFPVGFR